MAKLVIYLDERELYDEFDGKPVVGREYKVLERSNIMSNAVSYRFDENTSEGFGGNMDNSVKRFHGWRGTSDNIYLDALGIRKILKVTMYKNGGARILMSEDLHPELD